MSWVLANGPGAFGSPSTKGRQLYLLIYIYMYHSVYIYLAIYQSISVFINPSQSVHTHTLTHTHIYIYLFGYLYLSIYLSIYLSLFFIPRKVTKLPNTNFKNKIKILRRAFKLYFLNFDSHFKYSFFLKILIKYPVTFSLKGYKKPAL